MCDEDDDDDDGNDSHALVKVKIFCKIAVQAYWRTRGNDVRVRTKTKNNRVITGS